MLTFSVNAKIEKPISEERREMDNKLKSNGVWKCTDLTKGSVLSCNQLSVLLEQLEIIRDFCITPDLKNQIKRDLLANRRSEYTILDNDGNKHNIILEADFSPEEPLFT